MSGAGDKHIETSRDFKDVEKHFVRTTLWLPAVSSLHTQKGRPLKYFTLPGPHALDVLFFGDHGMIEHDGRGYPGVCVCDEDEEHFSRAKKALGNTAGILGSFEDTILQRNADRSKPFWDKFPYDVYNLDFCGTCLPGREPPFSRTFQAIESLLNEHAAALRRQPKKKRRPFLLLVTIKAMREHTNSEAVAQLTANIEANRAIPQVAPHVAELVGADTSAFVDSNFHSFLLASIPKFLAHIGKVAGLDVSIDARAHYSRPQGYRITKFVLSCELVQKTLQINPPNYLQRVEAAFKTDDISEVVADQLSNQQLKAHEAFVKKHRTA